MANTGYLPGLVNFSCRIARCARTRNPPVDVNIIASLNAAAALDTTDNLAHRLGDSFARGHKEASGGIVPIAEFEVLMKLLGVGEKPDSATAAVTAEREETGKGKKEGAGQKNTLLSYFGEKKLL